MEGRGKVGTRIGLVGCVKSKLPHPAPARDLYVSALFRGRRAHVESSCDRWFILSAKHGLVEPDRVLDPYDETLKAASEARRRRWSSEVLASLERALGPLARMEFELHAGADYIAHGLERGLRERGARVTIPAAGLSLGKQLAYYRGQATR